jgi:glutathione S-transferase
MHSGFEALRAEMPMNVVSTLDFPDASRNALADIGRIVTLWIDCRKRHGAGGAFLFCEFSAVDAMFAPVASRFRRYQVDLPRFGDDVTAAAYRDVMMAHPLMQEWAAASSVET